MVAIALVTSVPALLAIIYVGSSSVFEDVVSLSTSGLYASYFIVCSLLLWRRVTGRIHPYTNNTVDEENDVNRMTNSEGSEDLGVEVAQPELRWGPWCIPGAWGVVNNVYACVYILFVLFWSFWPPDYPATPQNMNYSVLMTGVVISFSILYYFVWGKQQYPGPLVEREVRGYAFRKT
ncbi:MAG: hypothetical protein Q9201_002731 [Fulgogasparrea decipioides]